MVASIINFILNDDLVSVRDLDTNTTVLNYLRNVKKLTVSFWLDVSINKLMKRLKKNKQRPLLYGKNVNEEVKKIYYERKKIYNEADYRIKCDLLKSEEIITKILSFYGSSKN